MLKVCVCVCVQELNRLNLESTNGKLASELSVSSSYIDSSSLISPEGGGPLLANHSSCSATLLANHSSSSSSCSTAALLAKQGNKPKSGRSLLGGPAALSPLTPR